ncbi:unnamed protein product [Prunus armeniaca]
MAVPQRTSMLVELHHSKQFCFFLILVFSSTISTNDACNQTERSSLLSLALNLSSPSLNWNSDNCCSWEGITCKDGWVTQLLLPSKGLKGGEFPFSLGSLTHLTHLNLSHNSLYGSLEIRFLLSLNHLEILDLSYNLLSGELPFSLPSSSNIHVVDLSSNRFHGAIPSSFFQHAWNLTSFNVFRASYNNLSGELPDDIYNAITLAITLQEIALPMNSLNGPVSHRIVNFTNLAILDLYHNNLIGKLPKNTGKLSTLKLMLLHFNNLEGSLHPSLMNCTSLIELNLGFNNFEGEISTLNFSKLSQLSKLDLGSNFFRGHLPISLYSSKSLKAIRLSSNYLEGAMKILMGSKSLATLLLPYNFIGEEMPTDEDMVGFDGFENLRILALGDCDLTGQIPMWLYKLKKLEILDMPFNRITGSIPSWLGTLPRLFYINFDSNLISGEFPKELCKLPMLVSEQAAAQVDHNFLELPIFIQPDGAQALQYTYLSFLPPSIYLHNNSISGSIPVEIGGLQLLRALDLSNNFSGPIPTSTQIQGFNASAFEGNQKLCSAPLPNECLGTSGIDAGNKNNQDADNGHEIPWFYISLALGFIVGFWGVCGPLMFKKIWRHAYFQFLDNVQDRLYVMITVCATRTQRRVRI